VVLVDDVEAAVALAGRFAEDGETVAGVLPAEAHPGARVYLCAFHSGDGHRTWLAVDPAGDPVLERVAVRDAASIAALCGWRRKPPREETSTSSARSSSRYG
jgi:hypothetical protein